MEVTTLSCFKLSIEEYATVLLMNTHSARLYTTTQARKIFASDAVPTNGNAARFRKELLISVLVLV